MRKLILVIVSLSVFLSFLPDLSFAKTDPAILRKPRTSSFSKQKQRPLKLFRGKRKLSSIRYPHESFNDALNRSVSELSLQQKPDQTISIDPDEIVTARDIKTALEQIDFSILEDWDNLELLNSAFVSGRDSRFLDWSLEAEEFQGYPLTMSMKRRISWLYPKNGCFTRAQLLKDAFTLYGFPGTKKLFAFGDFYLSSPYYYRNFHWWYHVVVAARVGDTIYVFDPALNHQRPLEVSEWIQTLNHDDDDGSIEFSLCEPDTYNPLDSCENPLPMMADELAEHTHNYLDHEWESLIEVNYNPEILLGEDPPWRKRLHTWTFDDTTAQIGDTFIHYNPLTGDVEYFELTGLSPDGSYGMFPENKGDNENWRYLGDNLENAYLEKVLHKSIQPRENESLDVYVKYNRRTGTKKYYRQSSLLDIGTPIIRPKGTSDSEYWEYLGEDYPITFDNGPKQWQRIDPSAQVGDIYTFENPRTGTTDFFRLTRFHKALVVSPDSIKKGEFRRLVKKSARWSRKKLKKYLRKHDIKFTVSKIYDRFPRNQTDSRNWEYLHSR